VTPESSLTSSLMHLVWKTMSNSYALAMWGRERRENAARKRKRVDGGL